MMYTLSEAFELFRDQYPEIKISCCTFCNCMPDTIMLRANTPANMCLCTYHENMQLLVSAVDPPVIDLLQHVVCDVKSQRCMLQSCESYCNLSLWKQYCENTFTEGDLQEEISYRQWINIDCGRLECSKTSQTVSDALEAINQKLEYYLFHVFIKQSRSQSFEQRRKFEGWTSPVSL